MILLDDWLKVSYHEGDWLYIQSEIRRSDAFVAGATGGSPNIRSPVIVVDDNLHTGKNIAIERMVGKLVAMIIKNIPAHIDPLKLIRRAGDIGDDSLCSQLPSDPEAYICKLYISLECKYLYIPVLLQPCISDS